MTNLDQLHTRIRGLRDVIARTPVTAQETATILRHLDQLSETVGDLIEHLRDQTPIESALDTTALYPRDRQGCIREVGQILRNIAAAIDRAMTLHEPSVDVPVPSRAYATPDDDDRVDAIRDRVRAVRRYEREVPSGTDLLVDVEYLLEDREVRLGVMRSRSCRLGEVLDRVSDLEGQLERSREDLSSALDAIARVRGVLAGLAPDSPIAVQLGEALGMGSPVEVDPGPAPVVDGSGSYFARDEESGPTIYHHNGDNLGSYVVLERGQAPEAYDLLVRLLDVVAWDVPEGKLRKVPAEDEVVVRRVDSLADPMTYRIAADAAESVQGVTFATQLYRAYADGLEALEEGRS